MTSGSRMACRTRAAPAPSASSATPTGKPFHTTTLRRVLTNPRMAGLRVHRGEVIGEASWEPVISRGDFERLRGLFSGRPRQKTGRPHTYPYSGLLRCGHKGCGGRMTGSSRGATQKAYGCERCDRTWITARPVEAFMDEAVIATLAGEEFAASLQEQMRAWAAEDPATAAQEEIRAQWQGWGVEKKRRVLRAILEHVTVLPVGRGGRHQAEERLRPRWRV